MMTELVHGLEFDYGQWREYFTDTLGLPRFRADQICQWIYQKKIFNLYEMTNLSKDLRARLSEVLFIEPPYLAKKVVSKIDGTTKYLWRMLDGEEVESVLLLHGNRSTACISTQVGCPLGCTFCATGQSGFVRDLTAGEIVGHFLSMEADLGRDISNIVYMGMGEPLLNYDELMKSISILNHEKLRNLGIRRFTISTSGIVPGIRALADSGLDVGLSFSLHATNDDLRSRIMPVNRKYPLGQVMEALHYYQDRTDNRVTLEYVLLKNINDDPSQAYELAALLEGLKVYVNLIPYNPVCEKYKRPSASRISRFAEALSALGVESEVRQEKGSDIDAACGQLRRRSME